MQSPNRWCWTARDDGATTLFLSGDWRLASLADIDDALAAVRLRTGVHALDGGALAALDTAAALLLLDRIAAAGLDPASLTLANFSASHRQVIGLVSARLAGIARAPEARRLGWVPSLGQKAVWIGALLAGHVEFLGRTAEALARAARRPRELRLKELAVQFEQACINAVPVVALVTFLIGIVVAYLLGMQAETYGANIFVVDGVGIGLTREFSPLIVATIVAGRSGAAFTAQLGTMRLTEETDAIRTLGLSPMQVLVVPRVLALMAALPLLVFVGDVLGVAGAMLVAEPMLDITPATFLDRLHWALAPKHYLIGLAKAPVFALFIAVIGCRMGFATNRDTRSIGINTTSTVVQSIVAVILLDAFFAVFFQELGI